MGLGVGSQTRHHDLHGGLQKTMTCVHRSQPTTTSNNLVIVLLVGVPACKRTGERRACLQQRIATQNETYYLAAGVIWVFAEGLKKKKKNNLKPIILQECCRKSDPHLVPGVIWLLLAVIWRFFWDLWKRPDDLLLIGKHVNRSLVRIGVWREF